MNMLSLIFGTPVREKTLVPSFRRFVSAKPLTVWHKPRYEVFPSEADAPQRNEISSLSISRF